MKTYRHIHECERNQHKSWEQQAAETYKWYSSEWFAEFVTLQLSFYAEQLPDCYKTPKEYLFDLFADFPWDEKRLVVYDLLTNDPRWKDRWAKACATFLATHGEVIDITK